MLPGCLFETSPLLGELKLQDTVKSYYETFVSISLLSKILGATFERVTLES